MDGAPPPPAQEPMNAINGLVHLRVAGHGGLVSRVVEHDGDRLTIRAPLAEGGGQVLPDPAQPLDVGIVSGTGVDWFAAVVTALKPGTPPLLQLRLLGRSVGKERRGAPRAAHEIEVQLRPVSSEAPATGTLLEVSETGFRVASSHPFEVGELVQIAIPVAGEETISTTARVVHAFGGRTWGLSFELAPVDLRRRLARLAFRELAHGGEPTHTPAA